MHLPIRWIGMISLALTPSLQAIDAPAPAATKSLVFELSQPLESEMSRGAIAAFTQILERQGFTLKVVQLPARRGLEELKSERIQGSIGRTGDIAKTFGIKNVVRIDFPIVTLSTSMWCRKNITGSVKKIRLAYRLGSVISEKMVAEVDKDHVNVEAINNYRNMVQMLQQERLECLIANEMIMQGEKIATQELQIFDRHEILTARAYPWILAAYAHLKPILEKGLQDYPFPASYQQKYQSNKPGCDGEFDVLCPDGIVFKKKVKF